jgi:dTDP-4-amino-4,6-dideoxygalactose transaminase
MNIPFLDLKAINSRHAAELKAAAARVIDAGWYVLGDEVKAFEGEFAAWTGLPHCVGTSDGLSALILALRGWKELGLLKEGDGVAVPANTYIASILAITENRLRPVLVEPDEDTFNLGAGKLAAALTPDVKAVLAVHLYGQLADMPAIANLCRERGLLLLEDAAQSHGAHMDGIKAGAWGDAAAFSFYPGKNLGALGDAGALTCKNTKLAEMVRGLRNYGSHQKYQNLVQGPNDRLDELQAAFLRVKLKHLDADNARRREIAQRYRREIKNPAVYLPTVRADEDSHVWHLFVVRVADRAAFQQRLLDYGVHTAIHYPIAPHQQQAYAKELGGLSLPLTEAIHREVVSLPMSPVMTDTQVSAVVAAVEAYRA